MFCMCWSLVVVVVVVVAIAVEVLLLLLLVVVVVIAAAVVRQIEDAVVSVFRCSITINSYGIKRSYYNVNGNNIT